jgi:hypothetical protein
VKLYGLQVGVQEQGTQEHALRLWPDPTSDILHVHLPSSAWISSMELLDSEGRVLRTIPSRGQLDEVQVNVEHLPSGRLFIRCSDGSGVCWQGSFTKP